MTSGPFGAVERGALERGLLGPRGLENEELHHGPDYQRDARERERERDQKPNADAASAVMLHALGAVVPHRPMYRHVAEAL